MALSESELIRDYLRDLGASRDDVVLGIGDDAALLAVPSGDELVLTTDALVETVHFLPGAAPRSLGHRALAVNLSDIAAMGATPTWMLLSLVLPAAEQSWLREFCAGLAALARLHRVALVGGNLSRGPLSITIELAGTVPRGQALRRAGAAPGDALYVSGTLGDAAAGRTGGGESAQLRQRFEYPSPRVALGQALRGLASACIDVSDGLYVDAARLLEASGCAAQIDAACVPLSEALRRSRAHDALELALSGGEDYELCFSAAPARAAAIEQAARRLGERVSRIGTLHAGSGLVVKSLNADEPMQVPDAGFDHFRR